MVGRPLGQECCPDAGAGAGAVYVVSALASAVVESLADALRDTDDDPLWEKLLDAFGGWDGNLVSDLNPLNKLPVLREVFNALDGQDNGRMDTEVWAAFHHLPGAGDGVEQHRWARVAGAEMQDV